MKNKVLICAYACLSAPDKRFNLVDGGEGSLGWSIVKQLDRFFQLIVLTHKDNKQYIESKIVKEPLLNTKFIYFGLPSWVEGLQKIYGGVQIYAYLWQIKAYFVARKLHRENNFDIFHHVTFANDWMASFVGALLPIPYMRGPGGGAHKVPEGFVKKYKFNQKIAERVRSIGQWLFRHDPFFIIGQNRSKVLLVCNYEAKNAISKKWQSKVYFFPVNGISLEDLPLIDYANENSNHFLILTAGRLIKIKEIDLAIRAFKLLSDKVLEARFVILGDGPEINNLKNIVKSLKLENKVLFKGWLARENVLKQMADCDVFLFPSLRDGGGNVVVEAMASGKPVICFDLAGPGFHIDENCGIKIKPENPKQAVKDMAEALEKLYLDKDLRLRLGQGARKKAEKEYDWDKLGDRLFEIYKKVL